MDSVNNKIKMQRKNKKLKYSYFDKEEHMYTSQLLLFALFSFLVAIIVSLIVFVERFH